MSPNISLAGLLVRFLPVSRLEPPVFYPTPPGALFAPGCSGFSLGVGGGGTSLPSEPGIASEAFGAAASRDGSMQ